MTLENNILTPLVKKAIKDPFFVGWALDSYSKSNGSTISAEVGRIGCDPAKEYALCLCRLPSSDDPDFGSRIQKVANEFSCDEQKLLHLVRQAQVMKVFSAITDETDSGYLMAARDRDENEGPDEA
jgi:hypothetical protein